MYKNNTGALTAYNKLQNTKRRNIKNGNCFSEINWNVIEVSEFQRPGMGMGMGIK